MTSTDYSEMRVPPICATCGELAPMEAFVKFTEHYYHCRGCDFVFIWPRPAAGQLNVRYEEYGHQYYSNPRIVECFFSAHKVERELKFITRVAPKGVLLDVGCSMGAFVKAALDHGYEALGIDICQPAIALGQSRSLPLRCVDLLSYDPGMKFDVITMWATLEHLDSPNDYVARIYQLLRPGGIFIASVPNYSSLTQRILGIKDRYVGADHLNYWTGRGFIRYLSKHGFTPIAMMTYGFNPIAIIKDLLRGDEALNCQDMIGEQGTSHRWKSSPLIYAHRAMEWILNLFHAGDVVALAGRKK